MDYQEFKRGEKVTLDKSHPNTSEVWVVKQTPQKMFTTVRDEYNEMNITSGM